MTHRSLYPFRCDGNAPGSSIRPVHARFYVEQKNTSSRYGNTPRHPRRTEVSQTARQ